MVAACKSWLPLQTSTASHPAAMAATQASGTGIRAAMAFISMSSVKIRPSKPSSSRNSPCTMSGDSVPGLRFVEGWHQDVTTHQRGDAGGNRRAKRHELDSAEPLGIVLDQRQVVVRVGQRVAMAREVLPTGGDAAPLQFLDDGHAERRDVLGALGQRAVADHRVFRVREDVEHRREIKRDADGTQLDGQRARESAAPARHRHCGRVSPSAATT